MKGVPFLLKDLGAEAVDFPSNNGSRLFANTRYAMDSAIYSRLKAAGLVTFGRTTSPEGGVGPVTEAAVYGGPTRNPWNLQRTPGGSSGGAGAAVAAGIVPDRAWIGWRRLGSYSRLLLRIVRLQGRPARGCPMDPMSAKAGQAWPSTGS